MPAPTSAAAFSGRILPVSVPMLVITTTRGSAVADRYWLACADTYPGIRTGEPACDQLTGEPWRGA